MNNKSKISKKNSKLETPNFAETIEARLLAEAIFQRYGYDFRDYDPTFFARRARQCLANEGLDTFSALQERLLRCPDCFERLLSSISINVTSLFRDPEFYKTLRAQIVPRLRTYPYLRVWIVGCATGEEAYSLAILLTEEGLYDRTRIYATDISEAALRKAKDGVFPLSAMQDYTKNYQQAGGLRDFSEWYTADSENAILRAELKKNIIFATHNLATDNVFNEFHLILCRNVLIYFNEKLQARAHDLIYDSLIMFGVLGLGQSEFLRFSSHESCYETLNENFKLYKKNR